jgi:hypothetical protein
MPLNDLNELLAQHTGDDVDTLLKSASSSRRYRLERLLTVVSALFLSVAIPLVALAVTHAYAPNPFLRVVIIVFVLSGMYASLRLVLPVNRWLLQRAVVRAFAHRSSAARL